MISIFWTFCAYVMFPMACVCLFLMLSNIGVLEKVGMGICGLDIRVGDAVRINMMFFFCVIAAGGWIVSMLGLEKMEKLREGPDGQGVQHASLDDRYKLQLFRDQRNWWISFTNLVLWLVCWRLQALIKRKHVADGAAPGGPSGKKEVGASGSLMPSKNKEAKKID